MLNKTTKNLILIFCIIIWGFMCFSLLKAYHEHSTGISLGKTTVISVEEFIKSQPDIAIDLTENTPNIEDYINRYNR